MSKYELIGKLEAYLKENKIPKCTAVMVNLDSFQSVDNYVEVFVMVELTTTLEEKEEINDMLDDMFPGIYFDVGALNVKKANWSRLWKAPQS
ncbi:hypothetical protein [Clostridium paraputrificum]|uniref:Uncharacterized protein n=1 Tax=Clostridium paraputrificum TaxID=29363 RepID=A0A6N3F5K6_9CLOT